MAVQYLRLGHWDLGAMAVLISGPHAIWECIVLPVRDTLPVRRFAWMTAALSTASVSVLLARLF